ncbi:MAG: 3-phosphoglycerate dehydrogenase [Candidatus Binatia bacterium]|nr:MAG: 3-phosphoglycerate dehydrogenase [Candidatus Binatia bacterium]
MSGRQEKVVVVAVNLEGFDSAFAPVRDLSDRVELVHAAYETSWEEVSARRSGRPSPRPEKLTPELLSALERAEVVFGFVLPRNLPQLAPRLRWVATPATGFDQLRGCGVLESGIPVTSVGGLFAPDIAEHVFASVLFLAKRLRTFEDQRRRREWRMRRVEFLHGKTLGLVGVGNIGKAVAARAKAFGMRVVGVGRSSSEGRTVPGVDRLLERRELPMLLREADVVVVAVADTPETRGMIGEREIGEMKPTAYLVNVSRGTVLDEPALVHALESGRLRGAALDVFETEPLPPESPLWELENVLVTPHVAANAEDYMPRAIAQFAENLRRYLEGKPLENRYDPVRGY